jgi:hypothetical protein
VTSVYHIRERSNLALDEGYVGISVNPAVRFYQHKNAAKTRRNHLSNAIKKYGDEICVDVIASDLNEDLARFLEKMLRPFENMGWNTCVGGGIPPNPKGKERPEAYRKNISIAKLGSKNPMFGKKIVFSDSHKKKLSTALKGKPSKLKGVSRSRVACPKCGVTGGDGAMYRWHFENCRYESKP